MSCWICRNEGIRTNTKLTTHHIRGHLTGDTIELCKRHHNLVEGICGHCAGQNECFQTNFMMCWRFSSSLPPIYFRPKMIEMKIEAFEIKCPKCNSGKMTRVTFWNRTILPLEAYWKCEKCDKLSYLSLNSWEATDKPTVGVHNLKHIIEFASNDFASKTSETHADDLDIVNH